MNQRPGEGGNSAPGSYQDQATEAQSAPPNIAQQLQDGINTIGDSAREITTNAIIRGILAGVEDALEQVEGLFNTVFSDQPQEQNTPSNSSADTAEEQQ